MSEEFEPQEQRQIGAGDNQPGGFDQPGFLWDKAEATGRLLARAAAIFAYGGLDGVLNRPLLHEAGIYPHFATSAEGYRLVDGSGQTYLDWVNGWSSIILGHNHPAVREAMIEQAHRGSSVALMYPVEVEAGEAIVKMVPNAEMLAFGKNGSDSLTAAIRIARAATGREMVLQFGFHGFHDWYACLNEQAQGLLKTLRQYTVPFSYNDLAGLEILLHRFQGKVAAIVMEPVNFELPGEGYLQAVKDLAHRHGALLIWDEVVTAFRLSRGGAQAFYGVQPDLAVLGKAMANGMPLSAVVGPRDLMQKLKHTAYGMTFRGEAISLAAAKACLSFMQQHDVSAHLHRIGEELRGHFSKLAKAYGIHCELRGLSARMAFFFEAQGRMSGRELRSVFILECLKRGILTNGNILPSFAHDQAAINSTTLVFEQALSRVRDAIDASQSSKPSKARYLHDASAVAVKGCIGMVDFSPQRLLLIGWCLVDEVVPDSLHVLTENSERIEGQLMVRTDLVDRFPTVENVQRAGFRFELSADATGQHPRRFQLVATVNGVERFHCLVIIEPSEQSPTSFRKTGPFWLQSGVVIV